MHVLRFSLCLTLGVKIGYTFQLAVGLFLPLEISAYHLQSFHLPWPYPSVCQHESRSFSLRLFLCHRFEGFFAFSLSSPSSFSFFQLFPVDVSPLSPKANVGKRMSSPNISSIDLSCHWTNAENELRSVFSAN